MRSRNLELSDISDPLNTFLVCAFHYDSEGMKHRFTLPRLVSSASLHYEMDKLRNTHNIFRWQLFYSNFPHIETIFTDICSTSTLWSERISEFSRRVPYLTRSTVNENEMTYMKELQHAE